LQSGQTGNQKNSEVLERPFVCDCDGLSDCPFVSIFIILVERLAEALVRDCALVSTSIPVRGALTH
jgi:hypothetical protein